ncbi:hypothetical protein TNIN_186331 [Trichonephila inaurata madagascariensis]|uniref:Uncharacterized protein n=1 Tax=Trichonephila inaurata madagascariensis TaxID=2747483 RepID=A0A8X6XDH3_9ARAC|nr:hypothetical protein TNIN_186331 [Trichonephila inaurata madagascariensis]
MRASIGCDVGDLRYLDDTGLDHDDGLEGLSPLRDFLVETLHRRLLSTLRFSPIDPQNNFEPIVPLGLHYTTVEKR